MRAPNPPGPRSGRVGPNPATKATGPGDVVDRRRRNLAFASDSSPAAPWAGSRVARIETEGYPLFGLIGLLLSIVCLS